MDPLTLPIGHIYTDHTLPQVPSDVAVVMPTIMRDTVGRAIRSVYDQTFEGRIQLLIGVDRRLGRAPDLRDIIAQRPAHVSVVTLVLPFSTSARHGGVHSAFDGGALRPILAFMANSRRIAFLDDDNQYLPNHLQSLSAALGGKAWAWSLRRLIDAESQADLGIDQWDSTGPGAGRFAAEGGLVDTNCLMVDKVKTGHLLGYWSESGTHDTGWTGDRKFFGAICGLPSGASGEASVLYTLWPNQVLHDRLKAKPQA
jgi:hypothetical protein